MVVIETKIFGIPIHREQVKSPAMFKVPTAYERKQGEELCLQDDGDGFKWVLVKEGHVQKLDNPIPDWVSLGYSGIIGRNVSLTFFSRRLVLPH